MLSVPSRYRNKTHEGELLMGFGGINLMILSSMLKQIHLQSTKTVSFSLYETYETSNAFTDMHFAIPKSIFISQDRLN